MELIRIKQKGTYGKMATATQFIKKHWFGLLFLVLIFFGYANKTHGGGYTGAVRAWHHLTWDGIVTLMEHWLPMLIWTVAFIGLAFFLQDKLNPKEGTTAHRIIKWIHRAGLLPLGIMMLLVSALICGAIVIMAIGFVLHPDASLQAIFDGMTSPGLPGRLPMGPEY